MKDNEKENKTNVKKTSTVKKETTKKTVAKKTRYVKTDKKTQLQIPIAYYMCIANIIMLLITNYYIFYYM